MKFSVLMSVYKADTPSNLESSLNSIWNLQKVKPSQIVLVQDGPVSKDIIDVILKYKINLGDKFEHLVLEKNQGLAAALNQGFKLCKHELIARMDADDISFPDRFEKQLKYLNSHNVDIVGGQIIEFGEEINDVISDRKVPINHDQIVMFMKYRSPFSHPTILFKRRVFFALKGYDTSIFPEDYDFFVRAHMKNFKFGNLDENVLWFRMGSDYSKSLKRRWGLNYAKNELKLYRKFLKIGFYNWFTFLKVVALKIPMRLIPFSLYKFLYFKLLR